MGARVALVEHPKRVAATNAFGADLWRVLSETQTGNLAIAPASLGTALGMTELGANGGTAGTLRKVLRLALSGDALQAAYAALLGSWCKPDAP